MKLFLGLAIPATFLSALFNYYEEGYFFGIHSFLVATVGAIFGSLLSSSVYLLSTKKESLPSLPLAVAAVIVTSVSLLLYVYYALNGKAENSAESAAQVHVLVAPIFLAVFSLATSILAISLSVFWRFIVQQRIPKEHETP